MKTVFRNWWPRRQQSRKVTLRDLQSQPQGHGDFLPRPQNLGKGRGGWTELRVLGGLRCGPGSSDLPATGQRWSAHLLFPAKAPLAPSLAHGFSWVPASADAIGLGTRISDGGGASGFHSAGGDREGH